MFGKTIHVSHPGPRASASYASQTFFNIDDSNALQFDADYA